MPYIWRAVRLARWEIDAFPWIKPNDIQADALTDLQTQSNILSIWKIEDDLSNLENIITAIAATRLKPDVVQYIMVDIQTILDAGFTLKETPGDTPFTSMAHYHVDIVELSGQRLVNLARLLQSSPFEKARRTESQVRNLLWQAYENRLLNTEKMKIELKTKLGIT